MIDKVTDYLITNETIEEEDQEIYSYGIKQGVVMLLQTFSVILIGIVLGMWWQSVLFIFSYTPLRLSTGGIHAGRQWLCFIFTAAHSAVVLLIVRFVECSDLVLITAIAVSTIIILFFAPVEDKNKPFDEAERTTFKKRTRIMLAVELSVTLALVLLGLNEAAKCICITHSTLSMMVVAGAIKNAIHKRANLKPAS